MESTCCDGRTVNGNTLSFLYFATGKYMIERLILFHMPQSTFSEDAVPGQVGNQLDQFLSTTNRQKRTLNHHKLGKKWQGPDTCNLAMKKPLWISW